MKIVYCTKGQRGKRCLKALLEASCEIVAVVEPAGCRDEDSVLPLLEDFSKNIPVLKPKNINAETFKQECEAFKPDLMILAGYTQIIRKSLIDWMKKRKGMINLHGGKLPEYRGGSPLNWQIIDGQKTIGLSIIEVVEEIDAGDVYLAESFTLDENDTIANVYEQANTLFPQMLLKVVQGIQDNALKAQPQDASRARYWGSRSPQDSRIDWARMNALEVHNLVRAVTAPLGGADTTIKDTQEPLKIFKTALAQKDYRHQPGRVFLRREGGVVVMAKDRGVIVKEVQGEDQDGPVSAVTFFTHERMNRNLYLV